MRTKKQHGVLAALLAVLALAVVAAWVYLTIRPAKASGADTAAGLAYLEAQEQKEPAEVDAFLREREEQRRRLEEEQRAEEELERLRAERRAEYEARIEAIESGETDVWGEFHDYVILGDSRAVGFYYFDFLEKSRVLAGGGDTILKIGEHMSEIVALQPKYIFLCYGLNDVSIGIWNTKEEYVADLLDYIAELRENLPDAVIVVSSILPARDPAFELSSKWYQIPDFSAAIAEACAENGVVFVDNTEICETYANYWQPDGIHVRPEFYPYWARNLIVGIIRDEMETELS
ncbi:MAG: SGNH/GDSL hydrolase family protein [Faecousia sp.]